MKNILFALTTITVMIVSLGCHNYPFNPKASAVIEKFDPEVLIPKSAGNLPVSTVTLRMLNNVPLHITGYLVEYYGPDGAGLDDLTVRGGLSGFIRPDPDKTNNELELKLNIYTRKVYNYALGADPNDSSDDIVPITAKLTLIGYDENGNPLNIIGKITIYTK